MRLPQITHPTNRKNALTFLNHIAAVRQLSEGLRRIAAGGGLFQKESHRF